MILGEIADNTRVRRYEEGFLKVVCVLVGGWRWRRGGDSSSVSSGYLTNVCTLPATPHSPSLFPSPPWVPLRLIKLDQDDTNNWLKLGPVLRPNDPYLTPFVAMVSLFPRRAPFGTVYLGSVTSVLAQSPAEHNSPLTSWERRKGYIFRRCLGNYRRAGFLWSPHSSLLFSIPRGDTQREQMRCFGVKCSRLISISMPLGEKNWLRTPGDDLFWVSEC